MSRAFSQKLLAEVPERVCVYLREDVGAAQEKQGEVILDINRSGNWVRGFEMIGGFVPFSVANAVSPFHPVRPEPPRIPEPRTVTYDPEADAAFFYLEYDPRFSRLTANGRAELQMISHSLNPTALYGLDGSGGLVWVKIPIADAGPADQFLKLLRRE